MLTLRPTPELFIKSELERLKLDEPLAEAVAAALFKESEKIFTELNGIDQRLQTIEVRLRKIEHP